MSAHFRGPLLHARQGHPLDNIAANLTDPMEGVVGFFEDFVVWGGPTGNVATGSPVTAGGWSANQTGASATGSIARADAAGGVLTITSATVDEGVTTLCTQNAQFVLASNKRAWLAAKVKVSSLAETDLFVGFANQASPVVPIANSAINVTNGIYFLKAAPGSTIQAGAKNGANTAPFGDTYTLTADTYVILALHVTPERHVEAWAGGTLSTLTRLGTLASSSNALPAATTALLPAVALGVEGTTARSASIDWIVAAAER